MKWITSLQPSENATYITKPVNLDSDTYVRNLYEIRIAYGVSCGISLEDRHNSHPLLANEDIAVEIFNFSRNVTKRVPVEKHTYNVLKALKGCRIDFDHRIWAVEGDGFRILLQGECYQSGSVRNLIRPYSIYVDNFVDMFPTGWKTAEIRFTCRGDIPVIAVVTDISSVYRVGL